MFKLVLYDYIKIIRQYIIDRMEVYNGRFSSSN